MCCGVMFSRARRGAFAVLHVAPLVANYVGQDHRDRDHEAYVEATRARNGVEAVRRVPDVPQDVLDGAGGSCAAGGRKYHEDVLASLEAGLPHTRMVHIL